MDSVGNIVTVLETNALENSRKLVCNIFIGTCECAYTLTCTGGLLFNSAQEFKLFSVILGNFEKVI